MADKDVHQLQDQDVIEVQKDYFFDGLQLPVNIYMKLSPGHYLTIGKAHEKSHFSTLNSFVNPLSKVFVLRKEHDAFIKYVTTLTEQVINQPALPQITKARFVQGLADHVINLFEKKSFSNEQQLGRVSKLILKFSQNMTNFSEVSSILAQLPNDEAKHAMSTCMIAMLICEEMEFKQPSVLEKMALGCLVHDIGLKFVPKEILKKPKHEWTPEEALVYETHPLKSVEMLRDLKEVPNDVLLMVAEHHENALGTGYPKKIRDVKISPLGRVLIVADYFADLLFERVDTTKVYDAPLAIEFMEDVMGQPFNKQTFRALKNIINKDELKRKMQGG